MTARDAATALAATTTSDWVGAGIAIASALLVAVVLDRIFAWRGREIAKAVAGGHDVTPAIATRLRFARRLLYAVIVLLGIAIALSNFDGVNQVARSLLASGAIAAAILGFAARQTLANFVAGVMLAVTQPLRVGDWVYVEDQYGVVDDIRLTYTYLHTLGSQTVVIPNEKLASGILRNDTLGATTVGLEVSLWLAPEADAGRAVRALQEETGLEVTVAEIHQEGVRLAVSGERCAPPERSAHEAALRLRCLERLRADGLLPDAE
jgi:small-conductance mechanosensitive channel